MRCRFDIALAVALLATSVPLGIEGGAAGAGRRSEPVKGQARDEVDEEEAKRRLEQLRSLGYIAWDNDVDARVTGVTRHDPNRAAPGYNLYTNLEDEVYLVDLKGERAHTWRVPGEGKQCQHAVLRPDGKLLLVCVGHGLVLLDWDSKVVFDYEMPAHHDVTPLPDGTILVPYTDVMPYKGRQVLFDGIATISPRGDVVNLWSTYNHLGELRRLHSPSDLDTPPDPSKPPPRRMDEKGLNYYHLNAVEVLPETPLGKSDPRFRAGNLLICLRNVNLLLVLDQRTYSVLWHWGEKVLDLPHTPVMLKDGHILVFDNGTYRGFSRVLEIDPPSGKIVWKYEGNPPESFFSKYCGSSQRLGNGNTLILDSWRGRAFEVTREGEVVWEYWSPEVVGGKRKRIYRVTRVEPSIVEPLLKKQPEARK